MIKSTNNENNLSTVTTSFLVVLDSENATINNNGSWNSDVTFVFESPVAKPVDSFLMSMCVQQFSSPNSIYNINESNNYLQIAEEIDSIVLCHPYVNIPLISRFIG